MELLHPAVAEFFADQVVQELWILFGERPIACAVQEMHVVQIFLTHVRLPLGPLHAGRYGLEYAGGHAFCQELDQCKVRVTSACCKGAQEFQAEQLP